MMPLEDSREFARQVADLNKYGQALNQCSTVEEVVSLSLEAMAVLFRFSHSTFVDVHGGEPRVAHSTNPNFEPGEQPSDIALAALETGSVVVESGSTASVTADSDVTAALAVPAKMGDDVTAVLETRSTSADPFDDEHSRLMTILASHAATAISNIRSRERLERARQDLESRKELIELYDRLLRHDLGNELQVIAGFADVVAEDVDGQTAEHAEKIQRAAGNAADLIERVGDLVSSLEAQDEPEPRDLRPVLADTAADIEANYPSLAVEFDPDDADYRVYGGDLLDSVFRNIVSNAAVHNEGDVTVRITVAESGTEQVVVTVADDGEGVDEAVREEIFQMGHKGPDSSGSGFGLGFVRALTESYGGSITVADSEAGGAAFHVTLDRA
jgi:signal transduction histidine kinase